MPIRENISDGFAFTFDAFCTGGASGGNIIKYNEIAEIKHNYARLTISNKDNTSICIDNGIFYNGTLNNAYLSCGVKSFLDVVKNF